MKHELIYPCNLPFIITQKFSENPQFYAQLGMKGHNGWDFGIPIGTPIYATHDGTVFFAGTTADGAMEICIDTPDLAYRTYYDHLSKFNVTNGQKVKCGDLIGWSGNTGRYTTGPHLHFGIHPMKDYLDTEKGNGYNGAVDPIHFFSGKYPKDTVMEPPKPISTLPDHVSRLLQSVKDFQLQEGIKDFQYEQNLSKVKIGPKTLLALKKYQK